MPRHHCTCPADGSYYCVRCAALLARANGCPVEALAMPRGPLRSPVGASGVAGDPMGGVSEKVLLEAVRRLARAHGWMTYHPWNAKRSEIGFVDVILCHPHGGPLYAWELKTAHGLLRPGQQAWLDALARATRVESALLRPRDWPYIEATLRGP